MNPEVKPEAIRLAIPNLVGICGEALKAKGIVGAAVAVNRAMLDVTDTGGYTEAELTNIAERLAAETLKLSEVPREQEAYLLGICAGFMSGAVAGASRATREINQRLAHPPTN